MTEEVNEAAGDIKPAPAQHNLTEWGIWAMVAGVALIGFTFIMPEGSQYDADGGQQAAMIKLAGNLVGDRLIAAGFLMWLAGRVIDAFRHPNHY